MFNKLGLNTLVNECQERYDFLLLNQSEEKSELKRFMH